MGAVFISPEGDIASCASQVSPKLPGLPSMGVVSTLGNIPQPCPGRPSWPVVLHAPALSLALPALPCRRKQHWDAPGILRRAGQKSKKQWSRWQKGGAAALMNQWPRGCGSRPTIGHGQSARKDSLTATPIRADYLEMRRPEIGHGSSFHPPPSACTATILNTYYVVARYAGPSPPPSKRSRRV